MKSNLQKTVIITAVVAVVALGIAALLYFSGERDFGWRASGEVVVDERKTFTYAEIDIVDVQTSSTDITMEPSSNGDIEVRLHGTVNTNRVDAVPALAVQQNGEILSVKTQRRNGRKFAFWFYSGNLTLSIKVPKGYRNRITARASSGDIQLYDLELSELSLNTSSGDMRLRSVLASTVSLDSSSGDQEALDLQSEFADLSSSSGEISVSGMTGGVKAKTSSGSVSLDFKEFSNDLEIRTSSGDVELYLTEAAQFSLEARSSSGDVSCEFAITLPGAGKRKGRNDLLGTVGEGTHRVYVRTSSGDIGIRP